MLRREDGRRYFNPRSPCGERLPGRAGRCLTILFQSSLPVRGATAIRTPSPMDAIYFNPRSPCGERHAGARPASNCARFQSSLPVRGATCHTLLSSGIQQISILAPRAGSDTTVRESPGRTPISILAPRAGSDAELQPLIGQMVGISILAPRAGSDSAST